MYNWVSSRNATCYYFMGERLSLLGLYIEKKHFGQQQNPESHQTEAQMDVTECFLPRANFSFLTGMI